MSPNSAATEILRLYVARAEKEKETRFRNPPGGVHLRSDRISRVSGRGELDDRIPRSL